MAPPVGERIMEAWETSDVCQPSGPIVRIGTYKNLDSSSRVIVVDKYWPKLHGITFKFLCYAHNTDTGIGWIEVFGGPRGQQWVRSFPVHALRKLP